MDLLHPIEPLQLDAGLNSYLNLVNDHSVSPSPGFPLNLCSSAQSVDYFNSLLARPNHLEPVASATIPIRAGHASDDMEMLGPNPQFNGID